jgi:plastocyanin
MKKSVVSFVFPAALLAAITVLLTGCGGGGGGYGGGNPPASTVQVVSCATATSPVEISAAQGNVFSPNTQNVPVNAVVRWTNTDGMDHTVTSSNGTFNQGLAANGGTVCLRFTAAGVYNYICTIHLGMSGQITVQ